MFDLILVASEEHQFRNHLNFFHIQELKKLQNLDQSNFEDKEPNQ